MKTISLLVILFSAVFVQASTDKKVVDVSYYGLGYLFDSSEYSDHGPLYKTENISETKMRISITGAAASVKEACLGLAPQLDLEVVNLGQGKTQFQVLPTSKVNGQVVGKTGYILNSFDVSALEPKHLSVQSLALSVLFVNPKDEEESISLVVTLNDLASTLRARMGDDDSARVFEVVSLKSGRTLLNKKVDFNIKGRCY